MTARIVEHYSRRPVVGSLESYNYIGHKNNADLTMRTGEYYATSGQLWERVSATGSITYGLSSIDGE